MKKYILLSISLLFYNFLYSTEYFVATTGSNSNNGTSIDTPFASVETAINKAKAGDKIWVRGGNYIHSASISISNNGTVSDSLFLLAYEDEKPILNFFGTQFGKKGIKLSGSFWKIKGFEIKNAGDNGMNISGNNNTIEFCSFHDNKDTGLQLGNGAHDNNIINCDSYFNADPTDYGDADGFAAKLDVGTNNYFYGCRAWFNCDDGWDGYMRGNNDVSTTIENCWTWGNGYFKDGTDAGAKANGNGFKVGGSDDKNLKHNFTLINCLAFYNKSKGFDQNNNKGNMFFYNCTAFGNIGNDFSIPLSLAKGKTAELKNCVLFNGKTNLASFVIQESNSWDANFAVDKSDFISIDTTGVSAPRKSDGSLPDIEFMHLSDDSDLINAGIDLGFSYVGSAPDLGAFEYSVEIGVGIKSFSETCELKAYMENQNSLSVQFNQIKSESATISIYNLIGKNIYQTKLKGLNDGAIRTSLPVSLSQGIYLVKVVSNKKYYSGKFLVE